MSVKQAIFNIAENKLDEMKENFKKALAQKAADKLEEKKVDMGNAFFGDKK